MKKKALLLPLLFAIYEITIYLSMDAVYPALPTIKQQLSTSVHMAQYTASSWILGAMIVLCFVGPLSDRFGRRPILFVGGAVYVLSSILCGLAPNIYTLLLARFLQGSAMPSMVVSIYAVINEHYESQKAIHIVAFMNMIRITATALGPLLGASVLLISTWRWTFLLLAILGGISLTPLYFIMPETVNRQTTPPIKIKHVIREYQSVLTNAKFVYYCLITFLPVVGLMAWLVSGPFLVVHEFHYSVLVFSIMQIFIFGAFSVGNLCVKKFSTPENNRLFIHWGLAIITISLTTALIYSWTTPGGLWVFACCIMLTLLGYGLFCSITNRWALEQSESPMGTKVAILSFFRIGAGFVGTVCLALFFNGSLLSLAAVILPFALIAIAMWINDSIKQKIQH